MYIKFQIAACYAESLGTRDLESDFDRIYFYTNITSCILAKSRCAQYNPISGEFQEQFFGGVAQTGGEVVKNGASNIWIRQYASLTSKTPYNLYSNALQVSESGDIRIITYPSAASVTDSFCSSYPKLHQSGFENYNC